VSRTYRKTKQGDVIGDRDRRNMKPSRGCLNHGGCEYCESNRTHKNKRRLTEDGWEDYYRE
jgi:hypothetical protein